MESTDEWPRKESSPVSQVITPIGTAISSLKRDRREPFAGRPNYDGDQPAETTAEPIAASTATAPATIGEPLLPPGLLFATALIGQAAPMDKPALSPTPVSRVWSPPPSSLRLRDRTV